MSLRDKFLKSFPPPQYIDVPYSSIAFSDSHLRLLSLDRLKHPAYHAEVKLESGIIDKGEVKDMEKLISLLVAQKSKLPSPFIKFSIPDDASYIFNSEVPASPGRDLRESVRFVLEENVPLPLGDVAFDFIPREVQKTADGYKARIVGIAASSSLIASYVESLRKAELEPIACMHESQATANAVIAKDFHQVAVIVHIHLQSVGIYIVKDRVVEFSSAVLVSMEDATLALKVIKSEVLKALEYWSSRLHLIAETDEALHCFVCGRHDIGKQLVFEIGEASGMTAELAQVWNNLFSLREYIPEISFEDSLKYPSAIGLCV
ncbi:MAG TPA: hypothetical protein VJH67_02380 [Candidatus Paceibacterota bacterium]